MRPTATCMDRKIKLKTLNANITCNLCKGYFIDATTVTECLHTFCKSCIVKYLKENTCCPMCKIVIHQSHPLNYISHDRTMQDIVFKLVPNLQKDETERVTECYKKAGLEVPKIPYGLQMNSQGSTLNKEDKQQQRQHSTGCNEDMHRNDEKVNIALECSSRDLKNLKRRFIRCSTQATITHVKKYLALKLYKTTDRYKEVDVLCNDEILGKDHTLKFICITRWRSKDKPLQLQYRPKILL